MSFVKQSVRIDILINILNNITLYGIDLFNLIISDNNSIPPPSDSRKGYIFETICIILELCKCININYNEFLDGRLQSLHTIKNINDILKHKINHGDNPTDMTIKQDNTIISFSIKYKDHFEPDSGCLRIYELLSRINSDFKIGLIVKDKKIYIKHKFHDNDDSYPMVLNKIIQDKLLLDESDIIKGLEIFCNRFKNINKIDNFITLINSEYLLSPRIPLEEYLHQHLGLVKFMKYIEDIKTIKTIKNIKNIKHNTSLNNLKYIIDPILLSYKPRSGKSILILLICKYLLENKYNKLLIMTAAPITITNFIEDLNKFIDFHNIIYKNQNEFSNLDKDFKGIIFCSTQYLKTNSKEKIKYLNNINFDAMIIDECHMGSSTEKTEQDILNIDINSDNNSDNNSDINSHINSDINSDINSVEIDSTDLNTIDDIRKNIKLNIFASGTAEKTRQFYKIKNSNIYEWEIDDEGFMKELLKDDIDIEEKQKILDIMTLRHGPYFMTCYNDITLNKDYSKYPTQVLMKHSIPTDLIKLITTYNTKHNANYGLSWKSILALHKKYNKKTKTTEYENKFELELSSDGIEILKYFCELIISNNKMNKDTIMKKIEKTQGNYNSRLSTKNSPKLFIIYLPINTGNSKIDQLQITFKRFIEQHNLWSDYNITYSNGLTDSSNVKENYNNFIKTNINDTIKNKQKGCILLLGNKGSIGVTYHDCDVTISLDDGHNLDNQKQRYSRALTETSDKSKTIGINVDMNEQRTYLYILDIIRKHKLLTKTTKTPGEILKYLYDHMIFLFNPSDINNGKITDFEITSYYNTEAINIFNNLDYNKILLDNLIITNSDILFDDEIGIKLTLNKKTNKMEYKIINPILEGDNRDLPKGDAIKTYIDKSQDSDKTQDSDNTDSDNESYQSDESKLSDEIILSNDDNLKKEALQKQFLEYVTNIVVHLLFILSRINLQFQKLELKDILLIDTNIDLFNKIFKDKQIILNKKIYDSIIRIMENNTEFLNKIREIYITAPPDKVHEIIVEYCKPSLAEKKGNAEISTPPFLADDMLNKIPIEFWTTAKAVFEPCCGKGIFIIKAFRKFFIGLEALYPDISERCKFIVSKCLYFADKTHSNVLITKILLTCEVQWHIGNKELDYTFNTNVGDTLQLDIKSVFNIDKFDAVIGNPPYDRGTGNKGKNHIIWTKFIDISLQQFLKVNGYLLYVHPPPWRQIENPYLNIIKDKQLIYLEIHNLEDGLKTFRCATRYDWYLLQNKPYSENTIIKSEDGKINNINLKEWQFIPNMMFDELKELITNDNKLDIWRYRSTYGTENKNLVSKIKLDDFKYPLVYTINKQNKITFRYTNDNTKGHFGLSKFIFSNGAGFYCDPDGEYGLTEWAYCIYDTKENLSLIEQAFRSKKFNKLKASIQLDSASYNIKILKLFKKDFYKDFINDETDTTNTTSTISTTNTPQIIIDGRKQYYLIEDKLYKVKKDKSQGILFGTYIDGNIIENDKPIKPIKPNRKTKETVIKTSDEIINEINTGTDTGTGTGTGTETIIEKKPLLKKLILKKPIKKETSGIAFQELLSNDDTNEDNEA